MKLTKINLKKIEKHKEKKEQNIVNYYYHSQYNVCGQKMIS